MVGLTLQNVLGRDGLGLPTELTHIQDVSNGASCFLLALLRSESDIYMSMMQYEKSCLRCKDAIT